MTAPKTGQMKGKKSHFPIFISPRNAKRLIQKAKLCTYCLRRQGVLSRRKSSVSKAENCQICHGMVQNLPIVAKVVKKALRGYEFDTFLVGTSVPQKVLDQEDEIRSKFKIHGLEGIKTQISRSISAEISKLTSKKVDHSRPDLTLLISLEDESVSVSPRSIWLSGRYHKHVRGLPQRSSICRICNGLGCAQCDYRGSSRESVQSIIERFFSKELQAEGCSFIWIGSEDENSLVRGNGRPLYVEIRKPRKRRVSKLLESGHLEVGGISLSSIEVLDSKPVFIPQFKVKCVVYLERAKVSSQDSSTEPNIIIDQIESRFKNANVQVRIARKSKVVSKRIDYIEVRYEENSNHPYSLEIYSDGGIPIRKFVLGGDDTVEPNLSPYIKGFALSSEMPFDIEEVRLTEPKAQMRSHMRKTRHRSPGKVRNNESNREPEELELI